MDTSEIKFSRMLVVMADVYRLLQGGPGTQGYVCPFLGHSDLYSLGFLFWFFGGGRGAPIP